MGLTDYSGLIAAVDQWMVYDDITGAASDVIPVAQALINREVRIRQMEQRQEYSAQTTQSMTLPDRFVEGIVLYENSEAGGVLQYLPPDVFWRSQDARTGLGQPAFYTILGDKILLAPTPDEARDYVLHYYIGDDDIVNMDFATIQQQAIFANAPDIYLWAICMEGAMMIGDPERFAEFQAKYENAKSALMSADTRARYRPGPRVRTRNTTDGRHRVA